MKPDGLGDDLAMKKPVEGPDPDLDEDFDEGFDEDLEDEAPEAPTGGAGPGLTGAGGGGGPASTIVELDLIKTPAEAIAYLHFWGWTSLEAVYRYNTTPPRWVARLKNGSYLLLSTGPGWTRQARFLENIYTATGEIIPPLKPPEWQGFLAALAVAAIPVDVPEGDERSWLEAVLAQYLEQMVPAPEGARDLWVKNLREGLPLAYDGGVWVNAHSLWEWLADRRMKRAADVREIAVLLQRYGATHRRMRARDRGREWDRLYWRLPPELVPGPIYDLIPLPRPAPLAGADPAGAEPAPGSTSGDEALATRGAGAVGAGAAGASGAGPALAGDIEDFIEIIPMDPRGSDRRKAEGVGGFSSDSSGGASNGRKEGLK